MILSFAALSLAACSTYSGKKLQMLTENRFYSPNGVALSQKEELRQSPSDEHERSKSVDESKESGTKTAKDLFSAYCANNKPRLKLKVPIRVVLPLHEKGTIIDEAANSATQSRRDIEQYAASFFNLACIGPGLRNLYHYAHPEWIDGMSGDIGIAASEFTSSSELMQQSQVTSTIPHAVMFPNDPKIYLSYGGA